MSVIENQMLSYKNVLSYRTEVKDDELLFQMVRLIKENIYVLDLNIVGNIIITKHSYETEFLIPVDKSFTGNKHYTFKPEFKLLHAVRTRGYGEFKKIAASVDNLYNYMAKRTLTPITAPYYVIKDAENAVVDIFIGVSENVL